MPVEPRTAFRLGGACARKRNLSLLHRNKKSYVHFQKTRFNSFWGMLLLQGCLCARGCGFRSHIYCIAWNNQRHEASNFFLARPASATSRLWQFFVRQLRLWVEAKRIFRQLPIYRQKGLWTKFILRNFLKGSESFINSSGIESLAFGRWCILCVTRRTRRMRQRAHRKHWQISIYHYVVTSQKMPPFIFYDA